MLNLQYRPQDFKEFIGHANEVNYLLSKFPDWPTTFLLIGPPGIGKTTLARLIAKQLGCIEMNLYEVDAGQDRGIDKIRELIKKAYERPIAGKVKVFILDEAQGLTPDAQQALLKVTEEAPVDTYFVFCSTDPKKIIKALRERCQTGEIQLNKMADKDLVLILKSIIEKEQIKVDDNLREVARLCIKAADGIPRRLLMLFEKFKFYPAHETKKLLDNDFDPSADADLIPFFQCLDSFSTKEFIRLLSEYKKGNYESLRIVMAHTLKKRIIKNVLSDSDASKYHEWLSAFVEPVDNQLGDIELTYRIYPLFL